MVTDRSETYAVRERSRTTLPPARGRETDGVILALVSAALYGVFPVVVNRGSHHIMPLTFAAVSTLLAAAGSFIYAALKGKLHELTRKDAYSSLLMVTLCIVVIPYVLFFIGSKQDIGDKRFTPLAVGSRLYPHVHSPDRREDHVAEAGRRRRRSRRRRTDPVQWEIPIEYRRHNGHCEHRHLPYRQFLREEGPIRVCPATILLVRFSIGGLFMLLLAVLIETHTAAVISMEWPVLLLTGLLVLGVGKIVWYEALGRLDISKCISLSMTFPLFSLIILVGAFKESVSHYQWTGIAVMMIGVFFSIRRPSIDPKLTRYAAK